jgi:hypothetical protein
MMSSVKKLAALREAKEKAKAELAAAQKEFEGSVHAAAGGGPRPRWVQLE